MTKKIVVCIKQVPDTDDIKWTEHNTIQREGLDSVINPYDYGALQLAKNIRFLLGDVEITVVTMGPLQAQTSLKTAVALGADNAYLLSDKKFACSDTLATAYTLSKFIKTVKPDFDLIICGQQAIDGDTAQTPSSLAEKLGIDQITNVISLNEATDEYAVWTKETEHSKQKIKTSYPVLIATTIKDTDTNPDINGFIKAQETDINILNADEINAESQFIGLLGSPTMVKKAFRPVITRQTILLENDTSENYAGYILEEISKCRENNG